MKFCFNIKEKILNDNYKISDYNFEKNSKIFSLKIHQKKIMKFKI